MKANKLVLGAAYAIKDGPRSSRRHYAVLMKVEATDTTGGWQAAKGALMQCEREAGTDVPRIVPYQLIDCPWGEWEAREEVAQGQAKVSRMAKAKAVDQAWERCVEVGKRLCGKGFSWNQQSTAEPVALVRVEMLEELAEELERLRRLEMSDGFSA